MDRLERVANATTQKLGELTTDERVGAAALIKKSMVKEKGFAYAELPRTLWQEAAKAEKFTTGDFVIEILEITEGIDIHYHEKSNAYVCVLGKKEGFENPADAEIFFEGEWVEITCKDEFPIEEEDHHGFRVKHDGKLTILVAESLPAVRPGFPDDIVYVTPTTATA